MSFPKHLIWQLAVIATLGVSTPAQSNQKVRVSHEASFSNVLTWCQDVSGYVDLDPAALVLAHMGFRENPKTRVWNRGLNVERDVKVSVLQPPKHGQVGEFNGPETYGYMATARDTEGLPTYKGKDRTVFLVEVRGTRIKAVVNLLVDSGLGDTPDAVCERVKFPSRL